MLQYKWLLLAAVICTLGSNLFSLIGPKLTGLCIGALLYLAGYMNVGDISSFVLYSRKFSGPINEAANIFSELQSALAAAERVFRLLEEEPEPADMYGAEELNEVSGEVKAEHISFGYLPGKTIIHDLSFTALPGRLIAIVGPTGAGKTTLINLLMRFYDPDSGRIMVDGKEAQDLTRRSLRGPRISIPLSGASRKGMTLY